MSQAVVSRQANTVTAAIGRAARYLAGTDLQDFAGLTRITKTLNAERVPAPRAQQGRPTAWAARKVVAC